ncbi:plasmid stabilization system protein [Planktothrix tepida]|nr:plasmid stabilization system protein [Planktothrix tepida]
MLVLTPKFKRAFRKFVKRNAELQQRIEETLEQIREREIYHNLVCS